MTQIVHVAQLEPKPFAEMLAGRKGVEYRDRKGRDVLIESLERGDAIVFREIRSARALVVFCAGGAVRTKLPEGRWRYSIPVQEPRLVTLENAGRKVQGWRTRAAIVRKSLIRFN